MGNKFERYDPKVHGPSGSYLSNTEGREYLRRTHFALNSIFTGLASQFQEKVQKKSQYGIYIPSRLSGEKPAVLFTEPIIDGDADTKFFSTPVHVDTYDYQVSSHVNVGRGISFSIPISVDQYGVRIAMALMQAGRAGMALVEEFMPDECKEVDTTHAYLINSETYQRNSLASLCEGVQTIATGIGNEIVYRLPSYPDPLLLVKKIVEDNLLIPFAAHARLGGVIPIVRHGLKYPRPLVEIDGEVGVSKKFVTLLDREREAHADDFSDPPATGMGCPVIRENTPVTTVVTESGIVKDSGVEIFAKLLLPYIEYYYENPIHERSLYMPPEILDRYTQELTT